MPWKRVTFTNKQIEEDGILKEMEDQFENIFMEAEGPSDMAVFSDNDYTDDTISFYFTPGCISYCDNLIMIFDGEECEPPDIEEIFLLAGNDDALDLLA
jgi:hypothetical protein